MVGIAAGLLYYHFIGCTSGTCAISSRPLNSAAYFGAMGSLFFGMFYKEKKQDSSEGKKF